jgi:hypothetical protein
LSSSTDHLETISYEEPTLNGENTLEFGVKFNETTEILLPGANKLEKMGKNDTNEVKV